jgi:hypothetical protein
MIAHRKLAQMPGIAGDAVWFPAYPGISWHFPAISGIWRFSPAHGVISLRIAAIKKGHPRPGYPFHLSLFFFP